MNDRNIVYNKQLGELINVLQPQPEQTNPLLPTWKVLHEEAIQTASIANSNCFTYKENSDVVFCSVILWLGVMLLLLCNYLERRS